MSSNDVFIRLAERFKNFESVEAYIYELEDRNSALNQEVADLKESFNHSLCFFNEEKKKNNIRDIKVYIKELEDKNAILCEKAENHYAYIEKLHNEINENKIKWTKFKHDDKNTWPHDREEIIIFSDFPSKIIKFSHCNHKMNQCFFFFDNLCTINGSFLNNIFWTKIDNLPGINDG